MTPEPSNTNGPVGARSPTGAPVTSAATRTTRLAPYPVVVWLLATACADLSTAPVGGIPGGGESTLLPRPLIMVLEAEGALSLHDPIRRTLLRRLDVLAPTNLGVSTNGREGYVTGALPGSGGGVSILDLREGVLTAEVPTIGNPQGVAAERDGSVWIAITPSPNVVELEPNAAGGPQTARRVTTPSDNVGLVKLEGRGLLYAASRGGATAIDPDGGEVVAFVETNLELASDIVAAPNESFVYVTHSVNVLAEISVDTHEVTRTVVFDETPGVVLRPSRIAMVSDGSAILVTSTNAPELVSIDPTTFQVVRRLTLNGDPEDVIAIPDEALAYVAIPDLGRIAIVDLVEWSVVDALQARAPFRLEWVRNGGGAVLPGTS